MPDKPLSRAEIQAIANKAAMGVARMQSPAGAERNTASNPQRGAGPGTDNSLEIPAWYRPEPRHTDIGLNDSGGTPASAERRNVGYEGPVPFDEVPRGEMRLKKYPSEAAANQAWRDFDKRSSKR